MALLHDLLADLLPGATVVWPREGLSVGPVGAAASSGSAGAPGLTGAASPTVGWVRVMKARVPAFDALEPGDLAIVPSSTLALVAPEAAQVADLVDLCRRADVAAILLVEGDEGSGGPGAVSESSGAGIAGPEGGPAGAARASGAARAARAPAEPALALLERAVAAVGGPVTIRAPRADIAALERAVIGYLVNRRAELDRQAAVLEADLERLALAGSGLAAMVAAIAGFLGRAVALEDRRGQPIAVHVPPATSTTDPAAGAPAAAAAAAYQAKPRDAGSRRVVLRVPLPAPGGSAGSLVLLADRPVGELDRTVADRIAALMALELNRDADVREARDARRADTLPVAGPPWIVLLARQRPATSPAPTGAAADAGGVAPGDAASGDRARREAVRRDLRQVAPARRLTLRGDADSLELRLVLAGHESDPDGVELAGQVAALLDRPAAVSRPFSAPGDRPAAEAEARATLEAIEALPDPPRLAAADRLGAYRLLGSLHHLPDGERHARALLAPLLAGRPDVTREHLATLRALLDHAGAAEAASALGVHRNTVAYRVRRIEALTGWRLEDPELRLAISIALRLVQIA